MAPGGFHGDGIQGNGTTVTPSDDIAQKATFGLAGALVFIIVVVVVVAVRRRCRRGRSSSSSSGGGSSSESTDSGDRVPTDATEVQRDSGGSGGGGGGYERAVLVPGADDGGAGVDVQRKSGLWNEEKWTRLAEHIRCLLKGHVIDRGRLRLGSVVGTGEDSVN